MTEFSIINRYCKNIGRAHPETQIGVGDDAAVVQIPAGMQLAVSVDTMVAGVHFFADTNPAKIANKLLAVNLSDMAAMGAQPKWATLALTMPSIEEHWLTKFSHSLDKSAKQYGVELIGGDTSQGPLVLSLQILGLVQNGEALTRAAAQPGDDLYVSGCLGDAALALAGVTGEVSLVKEVQTQLQQFLDTPVPQIALGQKIRGLANACIDLSDGLVADLGHICKQSKVAMHIDVDQIPLSTHYENYLSANGTLHYALSAGDDYQLAFTATQNFREKFSAIAESLNIRLTRIGNVKESDIHEVVLHKGAQRFTLEQNSGFQHFL